jgi:hypothetical protein
MQRCLSETVVKPARRDMAADIVFDAGLDAKGMPDAEIGLPIPALSSGSGIPGLLTFAAREAI